MRVLDTEQGSGLGVDDEVPRYSRLCRARRRALNLRTCGRAAACSMLREQMPETGHLRMVDDWIIEDPPRDSGVGLGQPVWPQVRRPIPEPMVEHEVQALVVGHVRIGNDRVMPGTQQRRGSGRRTPDLDRAAADELIVRYAVDGPRELEETTLAHLPRELGSTRERACTRRVIQGEPVENCEVAALTTQGETPNQLGDAPYHWCRHRDRGQDAPPRATRAR